MSATYEDANRRVFVLDGGFSSQISRHVGTTSDGDPLWTSRFLQTNPEDVMKTHLDFIRAGSDIISTNTYQASIGAFVKHLKISPEEGCSLIKRAVALAKEARTKYLEECQGILPARNILIAGSVGPFGAALNDGSEYSGTYIDKTSEETIRNWHKPRIDALIESGVDILAFETIPGEKEALVLVNMLKEYPSTKAWISFSCKDGASLAHGEKFQEVAEKCWNTSPEQLLAIGMNCCSPKIVGNLIKNMRDIPIVTYPNSGEKYDPTVGWKDDHCEPLYTFVPEWLNLNVKYIGGCCRTYCEDISSIRKEKAFGISAHKKQYDDRIKSLIKENNDLREENLNLNFEITKLKKDNGKLKDDNFSDYLSLMRERDARYTLYFENVALHLKLKELDGGKVYTVEDGQGDPVVLRIALDKCREQLSSNQSELTRMKEEYSETVPRREYDWLDTKYCDLEKQLHAIHAEYDALQNNHKRILAQKKSTEEELIECKERCRELERAGTPRPHWDICADFIGGGRERWWQLASGLSSRDKLRALLKELGPAAESEHLEYFDGLGLDPVIPPYLRYEGKVRNLRLSRREVSVVINDIWFSKMKHGQEMSMQDYVTKYFEHRYQQPSVRAEWAYNVCAGAEQMLDEPQVRLFWGVLHGHLSEDVYWGLRAHWLLLRDQLYRQSRDGETITIEEFEKIARNTFPLKSEVDLKNLMDVVKKQLKIKLNCNEINLDKLFHENEEGFDRVDLARELFRQRQIAQDKYIREVVAELGGRHGNRVVSVDNLKRAFAVIDPAINHIRMERYIRWAFSDHSSELSAICPLPLRTIVSRLATGDIERVGPRYKAKRRHYK
ncbi:translin-associated factor X-interacting protein 1-like [Colias croceus]|uniref:translin-associated factor X-interacting protein 1-like n=1 Tax=Colias crocea TaxID=72248 RepID=UPI001E2817C2|nr:translin-associated factor X-interacting protein 1-like [Colias croceus]